MLNDLRYKIASFISPEREEIFDSFESEIQKRTDIRVADILTKMDPFDPLLKKYNIIFSEDYTKPEDKLSDVSQLLLFSWAYGTVKDPSFNHLADWIRNTQGNATIKKANTDHQLFFGRAMVASISLFVEEVRRLSSRYEDIMAKKGKVFDSTLPVE